MKTYKKIILTLAWILFYFHFFILKFSGSQVFKFIILALLLYFLPNLWKRVQQEKFAQKLATQTPTFLDLLSLTLQSGQTLEQALSHLTNHPKNELENIIHDEMKTLHYGESLDQILQTLHQKIPSTSFGNLIRSIRQARTLGVSLAQTLEVQSDLIRTRRRQRAEELARTAAIKISLPLVLFIFPALLILYLGPGILMLLS